MSVLDATVGGPNANSYTTVAEADAYFVDRLFSDMWTDNGLAEKATALIMATRILNATLQAKKTFVAGPPPYYHAKRTWTGSPATTTQRLAWPRIGMFDRNGNAIAPSVLPQDLKDVISELAGQLFLGDRTLDNDIVTQGITSIKAGSVSLSFKDGITPQVLPDAVFELIPASWITDEIITSVYPAMFEII